VAECGVPAASDVAALLGVLSASRVRSVASSAREDQLFEMFVFSVTIVTERTNTYLILTSDECIYLLDTDRA
jgi:hypothetical protein